MISRRQLIGGTALAGGSLLSRQASGRTSAQNATPSAESADTVILDGAAKLDPVGLANLARERVQLGVEWLTGVLRPTGAFYYTYDPVNDLVEDREYNEVRHAGTVYALYQAHGLLGDDTSLSVGESAATYIERHTVPVRSAGRSYLDIQNGDTSLGGQALALVALLERRRVTAQTDRDELIREMATFLLWMEKDDRTGRYAMSFDQQTRMKLDTPDVVYYPGEALLALTRLAHHFPEETAYLDAAKRLANYLVHERDGDLPSLDELPREDHWLTIALSDLYRLDPQDDYVTVATMQADSMIGTLYTRKNGTPEQIGGVRRNGPISNTSTATKGEALIAAWALSRLVGDDSAEGRIATAQQRLCQFQMRVQYTSESAGLFPRPIGAIGGWPASVEDPTIRIDYVQHNLSSLIGMIHMVQDGDVPAIAP